MLSFLQHYTMHQKMLQSFSYTFASKKKLPADFLLSARQRTFHSQNAVSCLLIPGQARWVSAAVSVVFHLQKRHDIV